MDAALYTLLLLTTTLDVWATVTVFRAEDLEFKHRILQTILVWLLPVFGAAGVLLVRWSSRSGSHRRTSDTEHESWQNAQDRAHGVE